MASRQGDAIAKAEAEAHDDVAIIEDALSEYLDLAQYYAIVDTQPRTAPKCCPH